MSLRFGNPWALYLLWLAIGYAFFCVTRVRRQRTRLDTFVSSVMRAKLAPPQAERRVMIQIAFCTMGVLFGLIALSRPQWGEQEQTVLSRGRDVVIALDVSRSMLAEDVRPNRLSRAKADILDLIQALKGDRAALLAFRHNASLLSPLTTDYAYLRLILEGVDVDSAPRGETDIGAAIRGALDAFEERSGSHRTIVLISDGDDLSGQALDAAKDAQKAGVPIYTIGLGSELGATIPSETGGIMKNDGADVKTKLDHNTLEQIAHITGGAYIPIGTASMTKSNLGSIYQDYLTSISTKEFSESIKKRFIERYQYFLLPALLCFLGAAAMSQGRPRFSPKTSPIRKPAATIALILLGLTFAPAWVKAADTGAGPLDIARKAQIEFRKGNFEEAANLYRDALQSPSGSVQKQLQFNEAVALYQAGKFEEAARRFEELALASPNPKEIPSMELGMALYQEAIAANPTNAAAVKAKSVSLKRSAEAFRDAYRADPNQRDTAIANMSSVIAQHDSADQAAKAAALKEEYGSQSPSQLAGTILSLEREVLTGAQAAITNPTPSRIAELEGIAKRQADAADAFAMLKASLQAKSADDTAKLQMHVTSIENSMRAASRALRDLDDSGYRQAANAETAMYPLWKGVADPEALLKEDLLRQSRVVGTLSNPPPYAVSVPADQEEAANITSIFKERFEAMPLEQEKPQAQPGQQGQQPQQAAAMAPETKAQILSLCDAATNEQHQAHALLTSGDNFQASFHAAAAHDKLKQIEALMPKDKNQQQQNQDNKSDQQKQSDDKQNQDQKKSQDKKDQQDKDKNKDKDKQDQKDKEDKSKKDNDSDKDKKDQDEQAASPTNAPPKTPQDVKQALEKALQREREHEEVLRERNRQTEMAPVGRDW